MDSTLTETDSLAKQISKISSSIAIEPEYLYPHQNEDTQMLITDSFTQPMENNGISISIKNYSSISIEHKAIYLKNHQQIIEMKTLESETNNNHTQGKKIFSPIILPIEKENEFNKVEIIEVIDEYTLNCPKPFIFISDDGKEEEIIEIIIEDDIIE